MMSHRFVKIISAIVTGLIITSQSIDAQNVDINIQEYTPTNLLSQGQIEFKFFNNLYTQTSGFDGNGFKKEFSERSTFLNSISQFNFGFKNLNIGVEFWFSSSRIESRENSFLRIFQLGGDSQRIAISYLGPKLKIIPIKKWEKLAFEFTGLIPIANDLDGVESERLFVQHDRFLLISKLNYDHQFSEKTSLFLQFSVWYSLDRNLDLDRSFTSTPVSAFYSIFPNDKWTIYGMAELWPTWGDNFSYFFQPGIGVKYQLINGLLELEGLVTRFLAGKNEGAGSTFNLGIRIIR